MLRVGNRKVTQDFVLVIIANILSLFAGVISSLLIPKFLGVEEYGYLSIFSFYTTFVGFLHFGFNDGIYVRYGSYDYDQLPKDKFRMYFNFLIISQISISILVFSILSFVIKDQTRLPVYLFVCINILITNVVGLFAFINQITRRFKIYSINTVLSKLLYVISAIILILLNIKTHTPFIIILTLINTFILFIYISKSKELIFGKKTKIRDNTSDIVENVISGFLVMIGNFMGILIIGTGRLFLDKFFTLRDFAMYSFAITLLQMIFILITAVSTVVYPYLARTNASNLNALYERMEFFLSLIVGLSFSGYFILKVIVLKFLPNFSDSLVITLALFPSALFRSQINIVSSNFFKFLKFQKEYTMNNIIAFVANLIICTIAYFVSKSPISIALASSIAFYFWLLYSDSFFKKKIGVDFSRLHILQLSISIVFIIIALKCVWYLGIILYLVSLTIILLLLYKEYLKNLFYKRLDFFKL